MSGRPINLPEIPQDDCYARSRSLWERDSMEAYARAAVEADRQGIVVTDDDVQAAWDAADENGGSFRAALESFAKRLRGET